MARIIAKDCSQRSHVQVIELPGLVARMKT